MYTFAHIFYKDYTIIKPIYGPISIRTTDTGLFEVTFCEPILYRNTIQKLLFDGDGEPQIQGNIGKPGLEGDIEIPGVKGNIGLLGVK